MQNECLLNGLVSQMSPKTDDSLLNGWRQGDIGAQTTAIMKEMGSRATISCFYTCILCKQWVDTGKGHDKEKCNFYVVKDIMES